MSTAFIIGMMVFTILCVLASYRVGILEGKRSRNAQDVDLYIKQFWPDRDYAYRHGVKEGYAQAMSDMKDHAP